MSLNRVKILIVFLLLLITLSNCGKKDVSVTYTSSCDKLFSDNEANKYACYSTLAISKKDVTVCDKIPEGKSSRDSWKQTWKDGCYSKVASALKDKSICEKIKTQLDKDNCYKDVVTTEKSSDRPKNEDDTSIFGISNQDVKFFDTAVKNQDVLTCDKIKSFSLKGSCYKNISVEKGDLLMCDKIESSEYKELCYSDIGVRKKDISICNMILDQDSKYECNAVIKNDIKLCDKIIKTGYRESCFARITS
ncbi:hypothetical protein HYX00_01695 [Candidatus Woesearchaeota archaeon]|nr:hypothetical protein [Candidatus Woesearchaeota archaeon]